MTSATNNTMNINPTITDFVAGYNVIRANDRNLMIEENGSYYIVGVWGNSWDNFCFTSCLPSEQPYGGGWNCSKDDLGYVAHARTRRSAMYQWNKYIMAEEN